MGVRGDYHEVDRELDRLQSMPDFKTEVALNAVLKVGYVQTQAATHVDTGSLKNSETMKSESGHHKWSGQLKWGGPSAGVNNPVDYAIYEKARGDEHDFTAPTEDLDPMFISVIKQGLAG